MTEPFTMVNGTKENVKEKENRSGKTDPFMKDTGRTIKPTDTAD